MNPTEAERGQLVLVAAVVAALALVPVVAAYLQFGYAPAVATVDADHDERVSRTLERVTDDAAEAASGRPWDTREAAVDDLEAVLAPRVQTLETARLQDGVVVNVTRDESRTATIDCPGGDGRTFGDCLVIDGVVVQERDGAVAVVAVAYDVAIATPAGRFEFGLVVRPR